MHHNAPGAGNARLNTRNGYDPSSSERSDGPQDGDDDDDEDNEGAALVCPGLLLVVTRYLEIVVSVRYVRGRVLHLWCGREGVGGGAEWSSERLARSSDTRGGGWGRGVAANQPTNQPTNYLAGTRTQAFLDRPSLDTPPPSPTWYSI